MPLDLTQCLSKIVGLSENDCPCFDADRPTEYNESLSGFYLDDDRFNFPLKFNDGADCGEGGIWDILAKARKQGIRNFITDFGASSLKYYQSRLQKFSGNLAGVDHNYELTGLSTRVGQFIEPKKYRGVRGILNEIELYLSQDGTYTVNVYSVEDLTTPISTTDVVVTNGFGRERLPLPTVMNFSDDLGRQVCYYVEYDRLTANPKNIKFSCNCGSNDKPWSQHLNVYGVEGATVAALDTAARKTQYANGMRLHMDINCGLDWLCRQWSFSNHWDRVAAQSILLYGVTYLMERQLNDPQPITNVHPEAIERKLKANQALLAARMPWVAKNLPREDSDCYVCDPICQMGELV